MDWIKFKDSAFTQISKYKYVLVILLVGILLMLYPLGDQEEKSEIRTTEVQPALQDSLTDILSLIDGAGKVKVLLTEKAGEETIFQLNQDITEDDKNTDRHLDTVVVTTASREENGLIKQKNPPVYQGAIVICQGADSSKVKLSIVEAVKSVTGLPANCISVLKMK